MLGQALGVKVFQELGVQLGMSSPKKTFMGAITREHSQHPMTGNRKIKRDKGLPIPSETSVSCGVVARETEKPPLSKIEASSSDSSESVMAKANAVFFTSTTGEKPASSASLSLSVSASGSSPPGGAFFPCRSGDQQQGSDQAGTEMGDKHSHRCLETI